ncbi:aldose 1-epimerase family protein [Pseudomonas sp. TH05]|uniref:aldose 1-epimerase family protein n=1 Tax=unclassified Pseudomonas TaxID=196821 RepID=UPI0019139C3C|nr:MULTISPECIES: aldose 1-epimerase family protein [unclassified Pseudomonas]MBK5541924.1 aldose 1-epimerase family protein [Pseudomonas sp. TH07]MBK5557644.1 aldose 1-epimerase family protein [Pseudomonas sp. TH05]
MNAFTLALSPEQFSGEEKTLLQSADFRVLAWTYPSGVKALALENARGRVVALPYQGQMIWSATFDGCDLTMRNMFSQPRPSPTVIGTYGCFMFHAGLLRNGCPAPEDTHPLHGEMPCAPMDAAWLEVGEDAAGLYLRLSGDYEYVQGFGDHYRATPTLTLRAGSGLFDIGMAVTNLAGKAMELMYMAHMNYAYIAGGSLVEPLAGARARVRSSVPAHVKPTPEWSAYMAQLSQDPSRLSTLDTPALHDPEVVCFFEAVPADTAGNAHFLLDHPAGPAFYTRYRPDQFSHATRWILHNADQGVAAFVLPATCEPEGYLAEKAKGHVRSLAGGQRAVFNVTTGYLSAEERRRLRDELGG